MLSIRALSRSSVISLSTSGWRLLDPAVTRTDRVLHRPALRCVTAGALADQCRRCRPVWAWAAGALSAVAAGSSRASCRIRHAIV